MSVVGLLLSRSAELLQSTDRNGRTGLHIAAMHGHFQMVEILLGQGAEINATDRNGWTPLHCAAKAGHLEVVKLLCEAGASPKSETNYGCAAIWFAASEGHNEVLRYLMNKEHDTYGLMEDKRFVYNLMVVSKNHNNKPIQEFVLVSPAPVDTAAKLSNIYITLSTKVRGKEEGFHIMRLLTLSLSISPCRRRNAPRIWWLPASNARPWPRSCWPWLRAPIRRERFYRLQINGTWSF